MIGYVSIVMVLCRVFLVTIFYTQPCDAFMWMLLLLWCNLWLLWSIICYWLSVACLRTEVMLWLSWFNFGIRSTIYCRFPIACIGLMCLCGFYEMVLWFVLYWVFQLLVQDWCELLWLDGFCCYEHRVGYLYVRWEVACNRRWGPKVAARITYCRVVFNKW